MWQDVRLGKRKLISGSSSPVTVTCDLSPVKLTLQRFGEGKHCNLSVIENVADWKRCAKEFVCDSEVKTASSFVSGKCIQPQRRTLIDANARCRQPRAKKRLASALANEVLPLKLTEASGDIDWLSSDESDGGDDRETQPPAAAGAAAAVGISDADDVLSIDEDDSPAVTARLVLTHPPAYSLSHASDDSLSECCSPVVSQTKVDDFIAESSDENGTEFDDVNSMKLPVSESSERVPVDETRRKASDWVKAAQSHLKTPDKSNDSSVPVDDSAKKTRRKFVKNGLAEKLSKLLPRERTAVAQWRCRTSRQPLIADENAVILNVERLMSSCGGLSVVTGRQCHKDKSSAEMPLCAVFMRDTVSRCQIDVGSVVAIHPPWLSIKVPSMNCDVLLCTHFTQTLSHQSIVTRAENLPTESVLAVWNCPCQRDTAVSESLCEADVNAMLPSLFCHQADTFAADTVQSDVDSAAVSRGDAGSHGNAGCCGDAGILESIEHRGGSVADDVSFSAVVQRVFTKMLSGSHGQQWSVLVQDRLNCLCEIVLPRDCLKSTVWSSLVTIPPGRHWTFTGLHVIRQCTRSRHARLFSVVDDVLRQVKLQLPNQFTTDGLCMNVCFVLQASDKSGCCMSSNDMSSLYAAKPCHFDNLTELLATTDWTHVTFTGQVLHSLIDKNGSRLLYVTDDALLSSIIQCPAYVTVSTTSNAFVSDACLSSHSLIFTDVFHNHRLFEVDEYSRVEVATPSDLRDLAVKLTDKLPSVSLSSCLHDLVTVTGCVVGVDPSTSLTWLVCDVCHCSELTSTDSCAIYCTACMMPVTNPVRRKSLEVFVAVDDIHLRVSLSQKTIDLLLPAYDEDHEVDEVLGRCVGPLICVVTQVHSPTTAAASSVDVTPGSVRFSLIEVSPPPTT